MNCSTCSKELYGKAIVSMVEKVQFCSWSCFMDYATEGNMTGAIQSIENKGEQHVA